MARDGIYTSNNGYITCILSNVYVRQKYPYSEYFMLLLIRDDKAGLTFYEKLLKDQDEKLCGELLEW